MNHEQRTAIARIISDMIKADNIIEQSEIETLQELSDEYHLTTQDKIDAHKMRFSDAVDILKELSNAEKKDFIKNINRLSVSDNACVPREALLLLALKFCLSDNVEKLLGSRPYLISCPTGEGVLGDQYMVYLESEYNEERNNDVLNNFRLLVTQCRLNGFNFIYIPKMADEFKRMNKDYILSVIRYMAPSLSEELIQRVHEELSGMTTSRFFHEILYKRLNVKSLHNIPPSLLINVGSSVVPYCSVDGTVQYYTEFLCVPIKDDALWLVDQVLAYYQSKVSIRTFIVNDETNQFKYFGFYKALFDFLIAPPPEEPDLVFLDKEGRKYYIAFKFKNGMERKVSLFPKWYNLYFDVAKETCRGEGYPVRQVTDRTIISHIRNTISTEVPEMPFAEQYKPEIVNDKYVLLLEKNKIYYRSRNTGFSTKYEDIPLKKHIEKNLN